MEHKAFEVNFDGLVGPTHNYSGLSFGNIASMDSKERISSPKEAALQGLKKMIHLHRMGFKQAFLPPHERPHLPTLRAIGFEGDDAAVIKQAATQAPGLLYECSSAAPMWTANAATVAPSADTADHRLHITPANLAFKFHRSIEPDFTMYVLKKMFPQAVIHSPLPKGTYFADEGAANHTRFCAAYGKPGVHLFVYGRRSFDNNVLSPSLYPARHTLETSQAIARRHLLDPKFVLFAQQNPEAIDAGVFHNDVISVGNRNFFFYHEKAFVNTEQVIQELQEKCQALGFTLQTLAVSEGDVSLKEAVATYLFNSQILSPSEGKPILLAPSECEENPRVKQLLSQQTSFIPQSINLRESMRNGGGPACLRLRIVLTEDEVKSLPATTWVNDTTYPLLTAWVEKHYRDRLLPKDLQDPLLTKETQQALDELTQILKLGTLYSFQQ